MIREWCRHEPTHLTDGNYEKHKPRRYRCPDCKKRFVTYWRECEDSTNRHECWHEYLPPHKKSVKR